MNKKIKIALLSLVALPLLGISAVATYNQVCIDPEAEVLRGLQKKGTLNELEKEKLKGLAALEREEAKRCSLSFLSSEEKKKIVVEKQRGHEERLREKEEQKRQGFLEPKRLPPSELGIRTIDSVLDSSRLRQTNAWQGYLDDILFLVAAGGSYPDPSQGVVLVLKGGFSGEREIYSPPTATGPVKIIAEKDGIFTLESIAGEYEVYHEDTDSREKVTTPGGAIYRFNIRTRVFE